MFSFFFLLLAFRRITLTYENLSIFAVKCISQKDGVQVGIH